MRCIKIQRCVCKEMLGTFQKAEFQHCVETWRFGYSLLTLRSQAAVDDFHPVAATPAGLS